MYPLVTHGSAQGLKLCHSGLGLLDGLLLLSVDSQERRLPHLLAGRQVHVVEFGHGWRLVAAVFAAGPGGAAAYADPGRGRLLAGLAIWLCGRRGRLAAASRRLQLDPRGVS